MPKTSGSPAVRAEEQDARSARQARTAAARAERERKARRAKTRNLALLIALVVVAGAVAFVLAQRSTGKTPDTAVARPAAVSAVGTGYSYGTGPVKITVYEDFQCPICKGLEETQGASLVRLAQSNAATVTYVPIAILDYSDAGYSTRAANASYCVPQDKFKAFHDALYANQPSEDTHKGLTDAQVQTYATKAGVPASQFASCVTAGTYTKLVGAQTDYASQLFTKIGQTLGTPAVFIDGKNAGQAWEQPGYFEGIVAQETAAKTASASPSPSQ